MRSVSSPTMIAEVYDALIAAVSPKERARATDGALNEDTQGKAGREMTLDKINKDVRQMRSE